MKRHALLFLCIILAAGCARLHLEVSPPISQNRLLQLNDANGVATWALLPPTYNSQKATPWIIYNHGIGESISFILSSAPEKPFVQSLADAGFVVVASEYRNSACWGNLECADDMVNLQTFWRSRLNLWLQPFVIGESMGGIVTWNGISHVTLKPLAVVGIYPVCNLAAMYANHGFAPTIQTAYNFTSPSGYVEASKGFDPILAPGSTFAYIPIQIWASYSDGIVLRSQNEDPFAQAIKAAGGNVLIHTSHRDHGDASNFDSAAVISFFFSHLH